MSASVELNVAKKNLSEALGDSIKIYLQILKSWFKQKISREDFDHEARKLLSSDSVHLHNQFLFAILTKCQTLGASFVQRESSSSHPTSTSSSKLVKKKKPSSLAGAKRKASSRVSFHKHFVAVSPLVHVPLIQSHIPEPEERGPGYAVRDMVLPDVGMVHGRMIVMAWDYGLEDADDDAVRLLMQAVELQLKNILTVVLARRNTYHLRERRFRYGMGTYCAQSQLRNAALVVSDPEDSEATSVSSKGLHIPTIRPSIETGVRDASVQMACSGSTPPTKTPVTMYDLLNGLQVHKSAIPSHSVYAVAMERIINRLWHPSWEEFEQEDIHRQEVVIRRELHAQHAVMRT